MTWHPTEFVLDAHGGRAWVRHDALDRWTWRAARGGWEARGEAEGCEAAQRAAHAALGVMAAADPTRPT